MNDVQLTATMVGGFAVMRLSAGADLTTTGAFLLIDLGLTGLTGSAGRRTRQSFREWQEEQATIAPTLAEMDENSAARADLIERDGELVRELAVLEQKHFDPAPVRAQLLKVAHGEIAAIESRLERERQAKAARLQQAEDERQRWKALEAEIAEETGDKPFAGALLRFFRRNRKDR